MPLQWIFWLVRDQGKIVRLEAWILRSMVMPLLAWPNEGTGPERPTSGSWWNEHQFLFLHHRPLVHVSWLNQPYQTRSVKPSETASCELKGFISWFSLARPGQVSPLLMVKTIQSQQMTHRWMSRMSMKVMMSSPTEPEESDPVIEVEDWLS